MLVGGFKVLCALATYDLIVHLTQKGLVVEGASSVPANNSLCWRNSSLSIKSNSRAPFLQWNSTNGRILF